MRDKVIFFRITSKFNLILNNHQKKRIAELFILMIIGALMEMLSVSLILPFMDAVMSPDIVMQHNTVKIVCELAGISSSRDFLIVLAVVMAGLYFVKNFFLVFQTYIQYRFVYANMFRTQVALLNNYLHRSYEDFLNIESGEAIRVINTDTKNVFDVLIYILNAITEMVVCVILIMTVFIISPGITLFMAFVMFLSMLFILRVLRPILESSGKKNLVANAEMMKWMIQAIRGIKEIIIQQKEDYFERKFKYNGEIFVRTIRNNIFFSQIPRFMIEALAMSSFFLVIAYMVYKGEPLERLLPMLSAVAMAAVRLMPAVNRISASMSAVTYSEPAIDKMIDNLNGMNQNSLNYTRCVVEKKENVFSGVELVNVSYRYPSGTRNVLTNVNMVVPHGVSVGIIGQSGAGKTTVVDILLGLLQPHSGQVLYNGEDIRQNYRQWLGIVGYIPQSIFILDDDIRTNVAFGIPSNEINDEKVWKALQDAALADYVRSLPKGIFTQLGEAGVRLSGGQRQRIGIARALYDEPEVLVFDEATSALDNDTEEVIMESINNLRGRKTLIIIAHRLSTIANCDKVYRVESGKITLVK